MAELDPVKIFLRLSQDIPSHLRKHIIITGSLAAAYEYRVQLQSQAVNTKDADLVVHPAGDVISAQEMTTQLLNLGWKPTDNCFPLPDADPPENLRAIRLTPPGSTDYFIELLNVPGEDQQAPKKFVPLKLPSGYFGLPSFKFMGLVACTPRMSAEGIEYAAPAMMALANLLSHPHVTDTEIETGEFRGVRRCAKDLGRVIALTSLQGREGTEQWKTQWHAALKKCFPTTWSHYALSAGSGLRELLNDDDVIEQARMTTEAGLLKGKNYDVAALRAFGQRLLLDAIDDFENIAILGS